MRDLFHALLSAIGNNILWGTGHNILWGTGTDTGRTEAVVPRARLRPARGVRRGRR